MADLLPAALRDVIDALGRLPGVGSRTAERYAYYLLKANDSVGQSIAESVKNLQSGVKLCPKTFALIDADSDISTLYSDPRRDKKTIAVVEEPLDIIALERTGQYNGTYHVLGGAISPIDGVGPDELRFKELIKRISDDDVDEVIIATNASVEGESTAIYLEKQIKDSGLTVKLTRLARGIPVGVDLEYADQITLTHALEGRKQI